MIERVRLQDVTIFEDFQWDDLGGVNVVIGENDTGKSNLLKMLYAVTRSLEQSTKLDENIAAHVKAPQGPWKERLAEKLRWTFQPPSLQLGKIVRKGTDSALRVRCEFENETYADFSFTSSAESEIRDTSHAMSAPFPWGVFIPPEEVLSTMGAVSVTREQRQVIGFGDAHYDLVRALRQPESYHEKQGGLTSAQKKLNDMFPGEFVQRKDGTFEYRRGSSRFEMTQTADGFKKLGSLVHLLRNGVILGDSILFIDEPEASLNPDKILTLVEILFQLALNGVQIFVATHSYVVLKQFELLAREHDAKTPLCVLERDEETGSVRARHSDLRDRVPRNVIVDASVELFERDVSLELK
jgi:AAA15 family ATPase/GTPase